MEFYEPVMPAFEQISTKRSWNDQSRVEAAEIFTACSNFWFIVTSVILDQILVYFCSAVRESSLKDAAKANNEIELK